MEDGISGVDYQSESASETEKSITRSISSILNLLESPKSEPSTPHSEILKDVVAFVDVRSTFENRSKAVASQLRKLGATVVPKFTNEVTHVIFRDGKKSVQDKAKKKKLPLLSALWIEACKKNGCRVSEEQYPAALLQTQDLPLAITRLRRNKSMQPKDFKEELANSAERIQRRKKRFENKLKWKNEGMPDAQQLNHDQFFVADTESMSPAFRFGLCKISIPETPPSMRRKLEELRRGKNVSQLANTSLEGISIQETPPTSAIQKRLFSGSNIPTPQDTSFSSPGSVKQCTEDTEGVGFSKSIKEVSPKVIPNAEANNNRNALLPKPFSLEETCSETETRPRCKSNLLQQENSNVVPDVCNLDAETSKVVQQKPIQDKTDEVSSADTQKAGVPLNSHVTNRVRKRKLLKLDEQPLEKLLSPVIIQGFESNKVKQCHFPIPKKPSSLSSVNIFPAGYQPKIQRHKRKADQLQTTVSMDGLDGNLQKCSKSDESSDKKECHEEELGVSLETEKSSGKVEKAKQRRKSVVPKQRSVQKTTRRQSCMPSVTSQGDTSRASCSLSQSAGQSDSLNGTDKAEALCNESGRDELKKNASTSDTIVGTKPHRRKTLQPKKSPKKSTVTLVQRRGSKDFQSGILKSLDQSKIVKSLPDEDNGIKKLASDPCNLLADTLSVGDTHTLSSSGRSVLQSLPEDISVKVSRRSIDEFSLAKHRYSKKKLVSLSSALDSSNDDDKEHKQEDLKSTHRGIKKTVRKKCSVRNLSRSSSESSSGSWKHILSKKLTNGSSRSLVMTSLHSDEQDIVRSIIKKLGSFSVEDRVSTKTTHVVCGNNRRTLNVLLGISTGCWLLSLDWVLKSLEAGHWLPEESFELKEYFPAAQMSRLARLGANGDLPYKSNVFSDKELFFVAENTVPCKKDLVDLLVLCGGQVTQCARKAQVCIGRNNSQETINVSEKWILDSITCHKQLPFDDYVLCSKPEN